MILIRNIALVMILAVITYTDFKRQEIDNEPIILGFTFITLFALSGYNNVSMKSSLIGFFLGGGIFTLLAITGGMGGGDIKLMALIGFFLGWKLVLLVMFFAFIAGVLFSIPYMVINKKGVKQMIPFGPSIAVATTIVMFFSYQILYNSQIFWYLR